MSKLHWWVWLGEWVEIEASDVPNVEYDGHTIYVLDDGEDPMDVLASILLLSDAA